MELNPDGKKIIGEPIKLQTNYFKILCKSDWCLYRYKITFDPEEDREIRQKALLEIVHDRLGNYMLNGVILYSASMLAEFNEPLELLVKSDDEEYQISITLLGDMVPGDPHYLQVYNNLAKNCLETLKFRLIGRNYYDANSEVKIDDHRLTIWPGYSTTVQEYEDGIFMCVDVMNKIMGQDSVLDIVERFIEEYGADYHEALASEITGLSVWTEYNNRINKIDGVDFTQTPISNVQTGNNTLDLTYKEFYKSQYGITVYHSSQPMLIIHNMLKGRRGQLEKVFLVPELCIVAGLTESLRNNSTLKDMIFEKTIINPKLRIEKLNDFNELLNNTEKIKKNFENWNLNLDSKLIELSGRILPNEKLMFADEYLFDVNYDGDWTSAFKEKELYKTIDLNNWIVLMPSNYSYEVKNFINEIIKSTRNFNLSEPRYIEIEDSTPESYSHHLEKSLINDKPKLIMIIVQGRRPEIFTRIMKKCYVEFSVPCQVITDKCFTSDDQQAIATKVAIQLNCKIGGIPWSIHIPLNGLMIIGIDTSYDSEKKNKIFGAVVASLNRDMSSYFSAVNSHENGEQMTKNLICNITRAIDKYRELNNGSLPSRIIIYRDGVNDGQVGIITNHEVTKIYNSICRIYGKGVQVNLAYIILSTRSCTRFFNGNDNPPLGTVVDNVITQSDRKDFYLVSQYSKDDTVLPTYYNIVFDTVRLSTEKIQIITYKLTHLYFNCSNTIRVPSVVQYAHKLAFLVSQSIHIPPDTRLEDLLYYL